MSKGEPLIKVEKDFIFLQNHKKSN